MLKSHIKVCWNNVPRWTHTVIHQYNWTQITAVTFHTEVECWAFLASGRDPTGINRTRVQYDNMQICLFLPQVAAADQVEEARHDSRCLLTVTKPRLSSFVTFESTAFPRSLPVSRLAPLHSETFQHPWQAKSWKVMLRDLWTFNEPALRLRVARRQFPGPRGSHIAIHSLYVGPKFIVGYIYI